MNVKEAIAAIGHSYTEITGLCCYFVQDEIEISSAKEKNFFCKCLKTSQSALEHCEECTLENYKQALNSNKVQTYSCHAGLVKWSVPVVMKDVKGVIISEGVISKRQIEESNTWIEYLSKKYNIDANVLLKIYNQVKQMTEEQVNQSIHLLEALIDYYRTQIDE